MGQTSTPPRVIGEPAWEIAQLFPHQGAWSEADYLDLPGNHLTMPSMAGSAEAIGPRLAGCPIFSIDVAEAMDAAAHR